MPSSEQLIVFVSPEASPLAREFQEQYLPPIRELARQMSISVRTVDVRDGAPSEVTITPLLVFQNRRGRSIFQGRYTALDRIRNFLRTSSVVPQGRKPLIRKDISVWSSGRARVAAPVKVAPLTGNLPTGYEPVSFQVEARRAIENGFSRFTFRKSVALRRADRMFYMDFNPWASPEGKLYLSVALFSQFHCKKPVFTQAGEVIAGSWKDRARLFAEAAATLEKAVLHQVTASRVGDGFDFIPQSVAVKSWADLDLTLPSAPKTESVSTSDGGGKATLQRKSRFAVALPKRWCVEASDEQSGRPSPTRPQLLFRFPAPLDQYAGEVRKVSGTLQWPDDHSLSKVRGSFQADPKSVTMGDSDLDHALQVSDLLLDTVHHPTSTFVIDSVEVEHGDRLDYGELVRATMKGTFTMKGVSVPLSVRTMFEPVVHADGRPRLLMRGAFEIALPPFDIVGPDPPEDGSNAHERLLFDFNLTLKGC